MFQSNLDFYMKSRYTSQEQVSIDFKFLYEISLYFTRANFEDQTAQKSKPIHKISSKKQDIEKLQLRK